MRTRLLILLVVAAGVGIAVPAANAHSPRARLATASLRRLRGELRATRAKLAHANSRLSAAHAAEARLQATITAQAAPIATMQSELSSAQQEVGSLRAALTAIPTPPTPLAVAVEQVRREVWWADGGAADPPGQLVAEAAMDYVVGHVSTAAYGYLELVGAPLPGYGDDVSTILAGQAGICGHASRVFAAIINHFGLTVRSVDFAYQEPGGAWDGHIAVEVEYAGGWHFFDPTYGQFWTDANGDVLSISDVRAGLGAKQKDVVSMTNLVEDASLGDDTWFETDPATGVSLGAFSLS